MLRTTFLLLLFAHAAVSANRTITVPTDYGDVLGTETDKARIFYGIPFAQPPVGELR